jgi:hypothetical protein
VGSTAPWWGAGVIALVGSIFGVTVTSLFTMLNTRAERRRLSRDDKISTYPRLARAGRALADTPIWPSDPQLADTRLERMVDLASEVAFLGSAGVNAAVEVLLAVAKSYRTVVADIQRDSKPGHRGGVDVRYQPKYAAAVADLRRAIDDFVRAGRRELEIRGEYRPIESAQYPAGDSPQ